MSAICDAHKKKVGVEQSYFPGEDRKSVSWRKDAAEKTNTQLRGPSGPQIESVGVQISWRKDAGMGTCPSRGWAPQAHG